ncbi:MAG: carbamoyl-phosphate synthase small subunit [Desulfovibrionales bacterium]|nr:carbamoyl-phosphate synthase small subunit [Desulfovibrionales bacterium]
MKAILALEDGSWFEGRSVTTDGEAEGEVIFNTGMTGYQEILTDPSYAGQIVCMTYPHIGNYGINPEDVESAKIHVEAFVVKECCKTPSNWRSVKSLPDYLKEQGVLGIEGVDTRALTRRLRLSGAMRAIVSTRETDPEALAARARRIPTMEGQSLGDKVSTAKPYRLKGSTPEYTDLAQSPGWTGQGPRLAVLDYGIKWSILHLLEQAGFDPLVLPASSTAAEVKALEPQAVFLSNGPGDPAALQDAVQTTAELADAYPLAGICLGHQLLGLALGGRTYKLKFGHHGLNHPVMDVTTGRIEISSQNHGFCVDVSKLDFCETTHVNLNDQTLEGFAHKSKPIIAIQHHPEAAPGPHDTRYFFTRFRTMVREAAGV